MSTGGADGKMLTGLKGVGPDGVPVTIGKAALRYVRYITSALLLSLGFVWIIFDGKGQGWHDKIAGSYVVPAHLEPFEANAVQFVPPDRNRRWVVLIAWLVLIVVAPGCLLGSLLTLGPIVSQMVLDLFGLR